MKTLNAKGLKPWTHWFFYGRTRTGKTTAAATFPRPFFIIPKNEGSITSLMGRDIPYVIVTKPYGAFNESTGEGGLLALRDKEGNMSKPGILDMLEKEYQANPGAFPYDTLVFDAMSHYQDMVIEHLTDGDTRQMDQLRYGKLSGHFRHVHLRLRNMGVHVVFIALDQLKTHEGAVKITEGSPMISGKGGYLLPSSCDVIAYFQRVGNVHRAHMRNFSSYAAGSRFPGMPAYVDNFNFAELEPYTLGEVPPPKPTATNNKQQNTKKK